MYLTYVKQAVALNPVAIPSNECRLSFRCQTEKNKATITYKCIHTLSDDVGYRLIPRHCPPMSSRDPVVSVC